MPVTRNCLICGKEFRTYKCWIKRNGGKYCSYKCSNKSMTPMIAKKCFTCGKEFKTFPCEIKKGGGKYCSLKCHPRNNRGYNHFNWKGGRMKDRKGYILIYKPDHPFCISRKYIFEHRLIVESQIDRYLTNKEVVHHREKINDNRPHMLMCFSSNSAHRRFHKNPSNVKPEEIVFDGHGLL